MVYFKKITSGFLLLFIHVILFAQEPSVALNQLAQTPPMGWNSYNCFGSAEHEDEVKANADYISQHLKQFRGSM